MPKKSRTRSTTPHPDDVPPDFSSWRRLVSVALLTGAVRHLGALLASRAVAWWQHD